MPDNAREIFAKNFSYLLDQRGKTQLDVANHLHVATGTVSSWANGQKFPRIDSLQKIAEYLSVRMSILTEENGMSVFTEEENEKKLIMAYRAADDRSREDALKLLLDHPRKKEQFVSEKMA